MSDKTLQADIDMDFVALINAGLINAVFKELTFACLITVGTLALRLLLIANFRPALLRVPELSRTLVIYLCYHSLGAIISLPYNAFVAFMYYFGTPYSRHSSSTLYTIYWLGHWQNSYTLNAPLTIFFLSLERCFCIKLATNQAKRDRIDRWLSWISIGTLLAAFLTSTCLYLAELPLDITSLQASRCESVSCLMLKWGNLPQLFFKCAISSLNIVCCGYFIYILHTSNSAVSKWSNCLIIVTICFELCLNFVPALVSIGFKYFGTGLLSNMTSTCAVLDAFCCTIYYSLLFVPPNWLKRANFVSTSGSNGGPKPAHLRRHYHHHQQQRNSQHMQQMSPSSATAQVYPSNFQLPQQILCPPAPNYCAPKMFSSSSSNINAGTHFVDWMSTGLNNIIFKQFTFACKLATAILTARLLLLVRFRPAVMRVQELSNALITFLCFHLAGAIVSLPYNVYVIIAYYLATSNIRPNMHLLYWLGQWQNTYTIMSPIAVLFLTLERCFIIKSATNRAKRALLERWLCWIGIGTLLATFSASTYFYLDELPLNIPELSALGCQSVSCIMRKWNNTPQMSIKCIASIINIACCAYFLYALHTIHAMMKLKNHLVIVTLCLAFCLDFMPALISICFIMFGYGLISNLTSTCTALDALCSAVYFLFIFVPPSWLKRRANAIAIISINDQQKQQQTQQMQRLHRITSSASMRPSLLQKQEAEQQMTAAVPMAFHYRHRME